MTKIDFLALLENFSRRPIPATTRSARHIYIWQDDVETLRPRVPAAAFHLLDLHALCKSLNTTPSSPNLARQTLVRALTDWLAREFSEIGGQRILAVTGCDLLARYGVSLGAFLQRANESLMIVFVVPAPDANYQPRSLPAFIRLQSNATFLFFKSFDDATVGG